MLFPTFTFGVFFAVVLPVSWALRSRPLPWKLFVLAASYWFYAAWDRRFVMLLVAMTLVNAASARASCRASTAAGRRTALIAALSFDLAVLGFFKYFGFFVDSMESHLGLSGPALSIILPVGISFYTFQAISYVVDVHRGDTDVAGLLDFAVYLSFFPQLVAGPIVRVGEFLPQMRFASSKRAEHPQLELSFPPQPSTLKRNRPSTLNPQRLVDAGREHLRRAGRARRESPQHGDDAALSHAGREARRPGRARRLGRRQSPDLRSAAKGLDDSRGVDLGQAAHLIGRGMFKKVVVADYLANAIVQDAFASPDAYSALDVLFGVYGYAVQIYADFSGYTDMAIGVALLMGFRFPQNFDRPYTAVSVQDFWRRWHMTLSRWLRDYLYIPLGGNRRGRARTYLNLLVTMTLGGLWHGAAGVFIAWGLYQGAGLAAERLSGEINSRRARSTKPNSEKSRASKCGTAMSETAKSTTAAPAVASGAAESRTVKPDATGRHETSSSTPKAWLRLRRSRTGRLRTGRRVRLGASRPPLRTWLRAAVVFHFVCAGWVLFNSDSLASATDVFLRLLRGWGGSGSELLNPMVLVVIAGSILVQFTPPRWTQRWTARLSQAPPLVIACGFAVWTAAVVALGPEGVADYIYFQF